MSNPKFTKKSNLVVALTRVAGDWSGRTDDPHPPVGNEHGTAHIARIEARFPEADWPSSGRLMRALLTTRESGTSSHPDYRGDNPRLEVRRITETPDREHPSAVGGDTKGWNISGTDTHDVSSIVEEMLPSRIKRQSDPTTGCGNRAPFGWFSILSADETNYQRAFVLSDELTLTVEIKTAVTPDAPLIVSVIGAQLDASGNPDPADPTIVASADGRVLEVVFGFRGGPGDTCSKATLELDTASATDDFPNPIRSIRATPTATGAAGQYRIRLTGIPLGTEGRFRVRTTSQRGEQGDWSSLDDDTAHVQLVVLPGAPLDIVFTPFAADPHILGSLNSPDPADYLTGAQAEVTALPDGISLYAPGMEDIGGGRRSDTDTRLTLAPGQVVSYRLRHRNSRQVVGQWSAPATQTVREAQAVTFSPAPGRLASLTPTITLTFPLADGARLVLKDPTDDTKVIYDSGATVLVNQTSHAFVVPAGKLAWGQSFRAIGSYVPDGAGTTYTADSEPVTYSIARLAVTALSVPDSFDRRIGTTDPAWLRTVTDPDGAAIASIEQEIRVAATPQGAGALIVDHVDATATAQRTIPGGTFAYESAVDARARAVNDTGTAGPWSAWLTITALQPPDVDLITPVDTATIGDPTQTLDWSVTGHGGRTQASAVVAIYGSDGSVLVSLPVTTDTQQDIPAFLLDDATGYGWDVTATDTMGMVTTSAQRTFTTAFTEPVGISVLEADADPDTGTVVLTWDDSAEPHLDHYEVTWLGDGAKPVRIDGGPETLLDGNPAFTGTTLTHIGARLGDNVYYVAVSNGWRSSDPVSASATLTRPDARAWELVDAGANAWGLIVTSASMPHAVIGERYQAPGGQPQQVTWGPEARRLPMTVETVPAEDGEFVSTLRGWMQSGSPVWVKGPAPYLVDPLWATLQDFTPTPLPWGGVSIDLDWLELGDPVYAVLPAAVVPPATGEGDIFVTTDTLDFSTLVVGS